MNDIQFGPQIGNGRYRPNLMDRGSFGGSFFGDVSKGAKSVYNYVKKNKPIGKITDVLEKSGLVSPLITAVPGGQYIYTGLKTGQKLGLGKKRRRRRVVGGKKKGKGKRKGKGRKKSIVA